MPSTCVAGKVVLCGGAAASAAAFSPLYSFSFAAFRTKKFRINLRAPPNCLEPPVRVWVWCGRVEVNS